MGENTDQLQATLGALLAKFEAMEVKMDNLGKQIISTQENVDEIRHRQAATVAPGLSSDTGMTVETGTSSAIHPVPRLANNRPPLLGTPEETLPEAGFHTAPGFPVDLVAPVVREPAQPAVHAQAPPAVRDQAPVRQQDYVPEREREYFVKPPKH